jgi:hypothetical protein
MKCKGQTAQEFIKKSAQEILTESEKGELVDLNVSSIILSH